MNDVRPNLIILYIKTFVANSILCWLKNCTFIGIVNNEKMSLLKNHLIQNDNP